MTVASTSNRNDYVGDGATSAYSYTFRVQNSSHLKVTVRSTSNVETVLTLSTHYTVSGVGSAGGGTVSLVAGSFSWLTSNFLTTNYALSIRRVVPLKQETDVRNQGVFFPETHEDAFDYDTFVSQQQQDLIDRSLKATETDYSSALTLPVTADRANKFLAFDGSGLPIAATGVSSVPVTAYAATILDDTTAADARTTLGFAGTGGTVQAANIEANAVTRAKLHGDANFLSGTELSNLTISATVATNALTIALKTQAGSDPSSSSPVTIGFRSATATSGVFSSVQATAAMSVVVPSGTTIGTSNAVAAYLWVYAINNAGAIELAVSLKKFDDGSIVSTSAVSGGSSATTMYSTSARSNVACHLIGRILITEATAGTWASAPTEVSIKPFVAFQAPTIQKFTSGSGTYTTPAGVKYLRIRMVGGGGGGGGGANGGAPTAGGNGGGTTFGTSLLTANGGQGGQNGLDPAGGSGGAATINAPAIGSGFSGAYGQGGAGGDAATYAPGGAGGGTPFGGGGRGYYNIAGAAPAANTGAGGGGGGAGAAGGGAGAYGGQGGGSGAFIEAVISTPAATYAYAIGAAGAAGNAGTNGFAGSAGAAGYIEVWEQY